MPRSACGQSWAIDYAAGMLIFLAAIATTYGIISMTFEDQTFERISTEAHAVANALMTEGYPENWDRTDLIRAGLLHDGRLSYRKAAELSTFDYSELLTTLPSATSFSVVLRHADQTPLPFGDRCSFGSDDLPIVVTPLNRIGTLAYYHRSSGPSELSAFATLRNATEYEDEELLKLLQEASFYDVIILEDPGLGLLVNASLNSTLTDATLREYFALAADYGNTYVVIGDLGLPVLGANVTNSANTSSVVANDDTKFLLNESAEINTTAGYAVFFPPPATNLLGALDGATHQMPLSAAGSDLNIVRWQYRDSLVYYFPSVIGTYDDAGDVSSLQSVIEAGIDRLLLLSTVNCTYAPGDVDADNLVHLERIVAGRGEVLTLTVYAWG